MAACVPPGRIVTRHRRRHAGPRSETTSAFVLEPQGDRTLLARVTDLRHRGMPRPVQWIAWVLRRWGRPVGKPMLEILRHLVEEDGARRRAA